MLILFSDAEWGGRAVSVPSVSSIQDVRTARAKNPGSVTVRRAGEDCSAIKVGSSWKDWDKHSTFRTLKMPLCHKIIFKKDKASYSPPPPPSPSQGSFAGQDMSLFPVYTEYQYDYWHGHANNYTLITLIGLITCFNVYIKKLQLIHGQITRNKAINYVPLGRRTPHMNISVVSTVL